MRDLPENQAGPNFAMYFGVRLRKYRTNKGYSQHQLAELVQASQSFIRMMESGSRPCPADLAVRLDDVLDTNGELGDLAAMVNEEPHPRWFQPFVRAEAEASTIKEFEPFVISGLLQTEEYATEVIRAGKPDATDEEIKHEVAARMGRREVFAREKPPRLWLILDEAALRREIGGHACMHAALAAVLDAASKPRMTVQVLPFSVGAHAALNGSLTLLESKHKSAYSEGHATGRLITDPDEVEDCAHAFGLLQSAALGVQASLDLIRDAMEGYGS